ncbi:MAG: hypothetical protein AB1432_13915 [Bacteroidota bacterium]|jgi:hypothetical protein
MKQIPTNIQHLFWDVNLETFEPHEFPEYTINRVLEFGNEMAVAWIKELFPISEIQHVIKSDKRLSPKSAHFWALLFEVPLNEIAALKRE